SGFGLVGHLCEMAAASRVTLEIETWRIPLLEGAYELLTRNRTGGMKSNREYFAPSVRVSDNVDPLLEELCYDPQTSGGLLVAVGPDGVDQLASAFARAGVTAAQAGRAMGCAE